MRFAHGLRLITAIVAPLSLSVSAPGTATAADKVALGGGAAIVVNGDTACTLTAIGNDNQGNLVGLRLRTAVDPALRCPPNRRRERGRSA